MLVMVSRNVHLYRRWN